MDGPNRLPQRLGRSAGAPWSDDRTELLKARWSQGASARQISEEFGCGMTRNAVLGKLHRLGVARGSHHAVAGRKASAAERARRSDSGLLRPPPAPDMGGLQPRRQRSVTPSLTSMIRSSTRQCQCRSAAHFSNWTTARAGGRLAIPASPISCSAAQSRARESRTARRIARAPIGREWKTHQAFPINARIGSFQRLRLRWRK
jgi:hypothetical protein